MPQLVSSKLISKVAESTDVTVTVYVEDCCTADTVLFCDCIFIIVVSSFLRIYDCM